MAGHTYVNKDYSGHTDIPSRNGGYDRGPRKPMYGHVAQVDSAEYTKYSGSPSKIELLKEYVHGPKVSTEPKYTSPIRGERYKGYGLNYGPKEAMDKGITDAHGNFLSPNKYRSLSPIGSHRPKEVDEYFSGPNTNPTNNINKVVGFMKEKAVTNLNQKKGRGILDELSTRVEPVEPAQRYARPVFGVFGGTANKTYQSTIDSRETMRKYRGTIVP